MAKKKIRMRIVRRGGRMESILLMVDRLGWSRYGVWTLSRKVRMSKVGRTIISI